MITVCGALKYILSKVRPLKTIRLAICDAKGFCLAEDICADRDLPPTDRSAMDGYAIRVEDLIANRPELRLVGEVAAGSAKLPKVTRGTCVRILTGASVPPGADTVVMVEQTTERDGIVTFQTAVSKGDNIRTKGEEVHKGRIILTKATVLGASQIGLCASVGKATVRVHSKPSVAVLCTGEELRTAGQRVGCHQLRDSNGPALIAALKDAGIETIDHEIVPDDLKTLAARLRSALAKRDIVILTGGVSVGRYDYVPEAVQRIGAKVHFHGIAMKPGRPQLYATAPRGHHIFGLPGNPLSVLTGFHELVLPAIRRMSGRRTEACHVTYKLPLNKPIRSKGKRATFLLCKLVASGKGLQVAPVASHGSADLVAAGQADGVLLVPRNVRQLSAGELVEFSPWRPM